MAKFSDREIAALIGGRRVFKRVPLPGFEGVEVAIRLLSDAEHDYCRLEAVNVCKRHKVDNEMDPLFFERVLQREIISRCCFDVATINDKPEPFFEGQEDVAKLDAAQIRMLFSHYEEVMQQQDPLSFLDEEEAEALVEQLKKEHGSVMLSRYDANTLWRCMRSLVDLHVK